MVVKKDRRRRQVREREARMQLIRDAAAKVFAEHGVDAATMEMVADEAELGKATLYYYFATKRELLAAIALGAVERLHQIATEAPLSPDDPTMMGKLLTAFITEHPDHAVVLLPMMAEGPAAAERRLGERAANEIFTAHDPLFSTLAPLKESLPRPEALVPLISSVLSGIAGKLTQSSPEAVCAELDLFFHLLSRSQE